MKRKTLYVLTTAVIGATAFFVGKNFTETTQQPAENINLERIEMTVEYGGLFLEYTDGNNFYSYWIPTEDLEKSGLIDTAHIVDWNTDGTELAVITENDCEYYAYKSADIYQNRNFVPVESVTE